MYTSCNLTSRCNNFATLLLLLNDHLHANDQMRDVLLTQIYALGALQMPRAMWVTQTLGTSRWFLLHVYND